MFGRNCKNLDRSGWVEQGIARFDKDVQGSRIELERSQLNNTPGVPVLMMDGTRVTTRVRHEVMRKRGTRKKTYNPFLFLFHKNQISCQRAPKKWQHGCMSFKSGCEFCVITINDYSISGSVTLRAILKSWIYFETGKRMMLKKFAVNVRRACFVLLVCASGFGLLGVAAGENAPSVTEPAPLLPVPSPAQMRWHKAEYIMFAHYGMKTFHPSGDHKGTGLEDPKTYNPTKFDANQWVQAAKAGGFKGIVLTTKHHDGFCNWRTDTTDHCVKSAPWKDGKGDVVRELTEACHKGGVYFGLYVSILDEHFQQFGAPGYKDYSDFYFDQLKELSTRYGRVDEYWFDGFSANGLKIDYPKIAEMIKEKQPDAVVYDSGMLVKSIPDRCVAWPGHHGGLGPDPIYARKIDGTNRWYPNEASIILQGNWFNTGAPSVSVRQMEDLYLSSTGVGCTPLMNVPPNAQGLIDDDTVAKLKQFKAWVDDLHSNNLARAQGVKVTDTGHRGNDPRYAAAQATDGNDDTYFATDDGVTTATLEIDLPKAQKINGFILQEYIQLGQRIDDYTIECRVDGQWKQVFAGHRIGYKRIILEGRSSAPALAFKEGNVDVLKLKDDRTADGKVKFPVADAVRLNIKHAQACPLINNFQVIGENAAPSAS